MYVHIDLFRRPLWGQMREKGDIEAGIRFREKMLQIQARQEPVNSVRSSDDEEDGIDLRYILKKIE